MSESLERNITRRNFLKAAFIGSVAAALLPEEATYDIPTTTSGYEVFNQVLKDAADLQRWTPSQRANNLILYNSEDTCYVSFGQATLCVDNNSDNKYFIKTAAHNRTLTEMFSFKKGSVPMKLFIPGVTEIDLNSDSLIPINKDKSFDPELRYYLNQEQNSLVEEARNAGIISPLRRSQLSKKGTNIQFTTPGALTPTSIWEWRGEELSGIGPILHILEGTYVCKGNSGEGALGIQENEGFVFGHISKVINSSDFKATNIETVSGSLISRICADTIAISY